MNKRWMDKALNSWQLSKLSKSAGMNLVFGSYQCYALIQRCKVKTEIIDYLIKYFNIKRFPKYQRRVWEAMIQAHNLTVEDLKNPTHKLGRI